MRRAQHHKVREDNFKKRQTDKYKEFGNGFFSTLNE